MVGSESLTDVLACTTLCVTTPEMNGNSCAIGIGQGERLGSPFTTAGPVAVNPVGGFPRFLPPEGWHVGSHQNSRAWAEPGLARISRTGFPP